MATSDKEINRIPLTFCSHTGNWQSMKELFAEGINQIVSLSPASYHESKKAVLRFFEMHEIALPHAVINDEHAKELLDTVYECEEGLIQAHPEKMEICRRTGRHIREYLADRLLEIHQRDVRTFLSRGENGLKELVQRLELEEHFSGTKALLRFSKKVQLYLDSGSYIHVPELLLSTVKVKVRSKARGERGNLWAADRREKYHFLEKLADTHKVSPLFTEEDIEFLVSQSSLDMLKRKTDLLLSEMHIVEPNRLKANYSRLNDHLHRSKQRKSDYEMRRELLQKMGASDEQIEYISARATYQTMKNLLKLANGKIAISDLMGGKRTIKKLMQRGGKTHSQAEIQISRYLIETEGVNPSTAMNYAHTRKNHSLHHLKRTMEFLKQNYRHLYKINYGFDIRENILRKALELGLSRNKLSKRALTEKDFQSDLRKAAAMEETRTVKEHDTMNADARRMALTPLKEVLDYETDTDTRKQLYFIYELFCDNGLCITKEKFREICLNNRQLFPNQRKIQDALEILNSAYRAIGQHGETLCVLPDYLDLAKAKEANKKSTNRLYARNW